VLDLTTICQRNDDLAIVIFGSFRAGDDPRHENSLVYPFLPLCLGDRARKSRL